MKLKYYLTNKIPFLRKYIKLKQETIPIAQPVSFPIIQPETVFASPVTYEFVNVNVQSSYNGLIEPFRFRNRRRQSFLPQFTIDGNNCRHEYIITEIITITAF